MSRPPAPATRVGGPRRPASHAAWSTSNASSTGSRALWQRVDRELTDAAPWVPLMVTKDVNFLSKRVGNYQYSPEMGMLIDQLWVR